MLKLFMSSNFTTTPKFLEAMVILIAVLGTSMVNIDTTAMNIALPSIQQALDVDIGGVQWIIDINLLTISTLLLISGMLGDRYGRVRVTMIGALIFSAASFACGLAPSFGFLLVARTVQGLGGALLTPGGLAIINATVAPERRGRVVGRWITFTTTVIALGPLLGGWLVDNASWRLIFFINVPLGIICYIVASRFIPESRDEETTNVHLDWPGAIALIAGLGGLLFGLIEGSRLGWTSPIIIGMFVLSLIGVLAFVYIEAHSPNPMMPLHFFKNRAFTGINLLTITYFMAFGGTLFFLTLNLLQAQGFTAFAAGLSILPITLSIFTLSTPMGALTDRWGAKPLLIAGILVTTSGLFMFARLGIEENYWVSFFPATLLFGIGVAIVIVPMTIVLLGALPSRFSGIASASNYAATRIGNMLAIAIFGAVILSLFQRSLGTRIGTLPLDTDAQAYILNESRNLGATMPPETLSPALTDLAITTIKQSFVDGFQGVMWVCVGLMVISLVITLVFIDSEPTER